MFAASSLQSFACTWKMPSPIARMAATGSTPCQNMCDGSKLQPMTAGLIARSRFIVSGL